MAKIEDAHVPEKQTAEIRLNGGTVVCTTDAKDCTITIKFRRPDGEEVRIAGISRMEPASWGPATFRVYMSDGEDYYTGSHIITIEPKGSN